MVRSKKVNVDEDPYFLKEERGKRNELDLPHWVSQWLSLGWPRQTGSAFIVAPNFKESIAKWAGEW